MKIKIFEPPMPKPETELLLRLVSHGPRTREGVSLVVCDSNGNTVKGGYIIRITHDGHLERFEAISPELGLKLVSYGRISMKPFAKDSCNLVTEEEGFLL
jgi:hypothetical protein